MKKVVLTGHQEESFHEGSDGQIRTHAPTQANPERMRLREIRQTQKDKHCMIPLHEISRRGKSIETEIHWRLPRAEGVGRECGVIA